MVLVACYALRGSTGFGAAAAMPLLGIVIPMKVLAPAWTPFLKNLYPTTPTLSVEATHARLTLEDVTLETERPVGVEGAVLSATMPVSVVTETAGDCAEAFPAPSKARTV